MLSEHDFNIKDLTSLDGNYWRLDWFGYLSYRDKVGQQRSEPLVDVYLSQFLKRPSGRDINFKDNSLFKTPKTVQVPISYLRFLRLGDVWKNGKRVDIARHSSMLATFKSVHIDDSVETMLASYSDELNNYILPFRYHPYHGRAKDVFCEVVRLNENEKLVVPHYVLLQAYFASSQYVFQQIFKFGLDLSTIYDPQGSYINSCGDGFILLKKWTHDVAASEVARMAFDNKANQVARGVSQSLTMQSANGSIISPKAKFPFNGKTDLRVFGKWCPTSEGKRVFVVYDIISCSAPYPFESLKYFRDNPGDKDKSGTAGNPITNGGSPQKPKPKPEKNKLELNPSEEPTNELDELEISFNRTTTFGDLDDKLVEKERQEPHKGEPSNTSGSPSENVSNGNTGDGGPERSVAPVVFQLEKKEYENKFIFNYPICRLNLFQELIQKLLLSKKVQAIEYLPVFPELGDSQGNYSFFPSTYSESRRLNTWQYINYYKGFMKKGPDKYKVRKAIAAKLTCISGAKIYLVEPERRIIRIESGWVELDSTSLFLALLQPSSDLSNYQLMKLLEYSSANRGSWGHATLPSNIKSWSVKHAANESITSGDYVSRQINIIENYIGFSFE